MKKIKAILSVILCMVMLFSFTACGTNGSGQESGVEVQPVNSGYGTDVVRTDEHQDITWDLIEMVEHDPELKAMLEKSIVQGLEMNPDPDTNPVSDLESYYSFIDRCYLGMPWQIHPEGKYSSLYDQIDQGMGCLYYICNQPLEALEDKGYYHNSLMYHEPFRSWFIRFLNGSGQFLSSEESWNDQYYQTALENPEFHLDDGTFESPENWKSFNDFFARRLSDPSKRPIAGQGDDGVVILPADSAPQGVWDIDENSKIVGVDQEEQGGIKIKSGSLTDASVLLGKSEYAKAFAGGKMTHTFLDIDDYHRYHVPVSGTIKEVLLIPQDDAPGGVITWNKETGRYIEYYSDTFGWQSIETRGVVIIETDDGGLAAVIPVGMCQVSSVNFEENIVPGARVEKGEPLGYFMFGGSDIVMLFSKDLNFEMTAQENEHQNMGQEYGRI